MLFNVGVSLYTSRITLQVLGVVDYGISNVVGGIVAVMTFLNTTMSYSTGRYITYDLGKNNKKMMNITFNIAIIIHICIGLFVILLSETVGMWFLLNKLVLPPERLDAAIWVLQFSLLTFLFSVMQVPYNACINAHEKMDIYAYFSILDVVAKLGIVFVLQWIDFDKLKLFAVLQSVVAISIMLIYRTYSYLHFEECRIRFVWNKERAKEMISYMGWNVFAHFVLMLRTQGVNIIINLFFGPALNAARAIAVTVSTQLGGFTNNFIAAMNPQIVKLYAQKDIESMHKLITNGSKYVFFLFLFLSLPFIFEIDFVLKVWLGVPPAHSASLCRLVLVSALIDSMTSVIAFGLLATAKIKVYQITMSILFFLIPILTYVSYAIGCPIEACLYAEIFVFSIGLYLRPYLFGRITGYKLNQYFKQCIKPDMMVLISSIIIPLILKYSLPHNNISSITILLACFICCTISIYFIGLKTNERVLVKQFIRNKLKRH